MRIQTYMEICCELEKGKEVHPGKILKIKRDANGFYAVNRFGRRLTNEVFANIMPEDLQRLVNKDTEFVCTRSKDNIFKASAVNVMWPLSPKIAGWQYCGDIALSK